MRHPEGIVSTRQYKHELLWAETYQSRYMQPDFPLEPRVALSTGTLNGCWTACLDSIIKGEKDCCT